MSLAKLSDPIVGILAKTALFAGLRADQLGAIAAAAERIVVKPGETLVAADTPAEFAIVIAWGECLRIEDDQAIDVLPEGSVLSEMAMFIDTEHAATFVAKSAVRALRIHRSDMLELLTDDPDMADHLVQCVTERLHVFVDALSECESSLGKSMDLSEIRLAVSSRPALLPGASTAPTASAVVH